MLFLTNLDQALTEWTERTTGYDAENNYTQKPFDGEPGDGPHQRHKAAMQDLALAILTEAERVTKREVERALAPRPSRLRAVCGRVLRGFAELVDPRVIGAEWRS
ncbi:hypothetical protein WME76_02200 [Sorangium sp. So ce119]|uniref:hypothetical protein n=1 Tax=Sorangium sp. So ce119 TaxID=3133279 RepID=UPI003F62A8D6